MASNDKIPYTTNGSESVHQCLSPKIIAQSGDDKLWKWDSNDVFASRDKTNAKDKYNFLKPNLTNQRAKKTPLKVDVSMVLTNRVKRLQNAITSDNLTDKAVSQYFPEADFQSGSRSGRTNADPTWQSERKSHKNFYSTEKKENSVQPTRPEAKVPTWSNLDHLKKTVPTPSFHIEDLETRQRLEN